MRSFSSPVLTSIAKCQELKLFYSRDGGRDKLEILRILRGEEEELLYAVEVYNRDYGVEYLAFLNLDECRNIGFELSYFGELKFHDIIINQGDKIAVCVTSSLIKDDDDLIFDEVEKFSVNSQVLFKLERDDFGRKYYDINDVIGNG